MAHPKELLQKLGASPLKALSQNFLTSPHWASKLVESFLEINQPNDWIWEIGPGLGALTQILVKTTQTPIRLFEIDRKLSSYLREKYSDIPLEEGDFLSQDWTHFLKPTEKVSVMSNLPYHLSSAMIFKMAEHKNQLTHFLFTFQKEFAARLTASPETKDYGSLTLVVEVYFQIRSLGVIPPGAFYPPPSVASEAILFIPRHPTYPNEENLVALIKAGFKQRRKKLMSNLRQAFPDKNWPELFENARLSENIRAESLTLSDFNKLLH